MNKNFSISEILNAVHSINSVSNNQKVKDLTTEKILKAVNSIQNNETVIEINNEPKEKNAIKNADFKTELKKNTKVKKNNIIKKKETVSFKKPLLLTRIIKYKPTNTKSLFLNKLHNSKMKIITMMPPGASK